MYSVNFLSKAKQSKAKQSKAKRELRALTNNPFKTFLITLLSLTLLFSISCSNEGTTGGDTGDDYWYNPDTNDIIPPPSTPGKLTASATKNITINIANQKVHSAGSVSFLVRPYELEKAGNFTVSIDSVAKATGNSSSLELTPADFSSLTPSSKELTLSADGLAKVNSASGLADATAYKYDITFKFTTTSDTVSNKTASYTSTVSLYKVVSVTKDMLKTMITSTPKKENIQNRSKIDGHNDYFSIDFSQASISYDLKTTTIHQTAGMITTPQNKASTFSPSASGLKTLQFGTTDTRKFISSGYCKTNTISGSSGDSVDYVLDLNYVFTLKSGYVLDNNISFITNEGLTLKVMFLDKGKWVEDSI